MDDKTLPPIPATSADPLTEVGVPPVAPVTPAVTPSVPPLAPWQKVEEISTPTADVVPAKYPQAEKVTAPVAPAETPPSAPNALYENPDLVKPH